MGSKARLIVVLALALVGCVDGPEARQPVRGGAQLSTAGAPAAVGNAEACAQLFAAYDAGDELADLHVREATGWNGFGDPCEGLTGVPTDLHQ